MKNKILLIIFIIILSCCNTVDIPPGSDELSFNSKYWKEILIDREQIILKNDDRQLMLSDLLINVLPGMTKVQVIELLGQTEYQSETYSNNHLRYATGWDRISYFPNVDSEWLIIEFDENDVFVDFIIFTS